jgi:hypothetical protein
MNTNFFFLLVSLLLDSISKMNPYQQNSNSHSSSSEEVSDTESDIFEGKT